MDPRDMMFQEYLNHIEKGQLKDTRVRILIDGWAYLEGDDFCIEGTKICAMSFKMQERIKPKR